MQRPGTLEEVREATAQFQQHYNWSRPHQGLSCGNRPPRVAFPMLPALPAVPDLVRLVRRDGTVRVDLKSYYVGRTLAGQHVALHLSAAKRAWLVVHGHQVIKTLPLKGLWGPRVAQRGCRRAKAHLMSESGSELDVAPVREGRNSEMESKKGRREEELRNSQQKKP